MAVTPFSLLEGTVLTSAYTAGDPSINVASTGAPLPGAAPFYVYVCSVTTGQVIVVLRVTAITSGSVFGVSPAGTDASAANGSLVILSYAPLASIISPGDFVAVGINAAGSAVSQVGNYLKFHLVPSSTNIGGFGITPPGSGLTFDMKAQILFFQTGASVDVGLVLLNAGNSHLLHFALEKTDGILVGEYSAPGTFVGNAFAAAVPPLANPGWLRISCDGTSFFFYIGDNWGNWFLIFTQTVAAFLGAFPTKVGVAMQNATGAVDTNVFNLQVTGT